MAKTTITAFIEESVKEDLKALAEYEHRSLSQMVAVLVDRAIKQAKEQGHIPDSKK
ncbi:hypothetical protein H6F89_28480 [Cyanobacteria bacterium FACHB-63]|nr:hypothetical protein [Cyanobacteria bacterium FACHB-63]